MPSSQSSPTSFIAPVLSPILASRSVRPTCERRRTLVKASVITGGRVYADATRAWMRDMVVELGLCPFASVPLERGLVRVEVLEDVRDELAARHAVDFESDYLLEHDAVQLETSVLVMPNFGLNDFEVWHSFCAPLEDELNNGDGPVMVACFHPSHTWYGLSESSPSHYDRRSPYPVINILRTESVDNVVSEGLDSGIAARNENTLARVGTPQLRRLLARTKNTNEHPHTHGEQQCI